MTDASRTCGQTQVGQNAAGRSRASGEGAKLLDRLTQRGCEFDFFQAVWLLERYYTTGETVGGRGPVSSEPLRFRPHPSMGFPSCDVRRITYNRGVDGQDPFYRIDVTFMGLYGVCTPLPVHYAADVLRSVEPAGKWGEQGVAAGTAPVEPDDPEFGFSPVRDFLDIFHHRLLSLFYRSWLKYRFHVGYGVRGRDLITQYLLWLIGCDPRYTEQILGVCPIRMLRYAGMLTLRPKSAAGLEGVLSDYWRSFPVTVEQCAGRWVSISPADLNCIGRTNSTLGVDLTMGEEIYDLSGAFSISVGPVNWGTYLLFLPDGECFAQTQSLVELYCADPLAFTIEMKLSEHEIPEMRLSSDEDAGRLGFTSWVRTDEMPATSVMFASAPRTGVGGARSAPGAASEAGERCEAATP
ncbi:MAG: type VI secretion system baseplate subunit TssG [Phycisphaerae bacterium]